MVFGRAASRTSILRKYAEVSVLLPPGETTSLGSGWQPDMASCDTHKLHGFDVQLCGRNIRRWRTDDVPWFWMQLHMPWRDLDEELWGHDRILARMGGPNRQADDRHWWEHEVAWNQETLRWTWDSWWTTCPWRADFDGDWRFERTFASFLTSSTRSWTGHGLGCWNSGVKDLGMRLQSDSRTQEPTT